MRRPASNLSTGGDVDIDSAMTPMIDVVFLLLVFFVWTASFQIVEQILPSELSSQIGTTPTESNDPPPEKDFDDVVIKISYDGNEPTWIINQQQPLGSASEMGTRLRAIADVNAAAPVILHPQPNVPLEYVIHGYDIAKGSGFTKVAFAVNPSSIPPRF